MQPLPCAFETGIQLISCKAWEGPKPARKHPIHPIQYEPSHSPASEPDSLNSQQDPASSSSKPRNSSHLIPLQQSTAHCVQTALLNAL